MSLRASVRLKQLQSILRECPSEGNHSPLPCYSSTEAVIHFTPEVSLFDQKVDIKVQGLPANVKVTLHNSVERQWRQKPVEFVSCSHYISNQLGEVDVSKDESFGGTYTGIEPMGLFWSVEAKPPGPFNIRMVQRDVEQPLVYNLSVYLGHLSLHDLHMTQAPHTPSPVGMASLKRLVKDTSVRRLPVREGGVRGTLFLPPGEGPFPGVIDMFGFAGGLMEARAALLASHGFATLSLGIFQYQDLPTEVKNVNFNYFEEAAKWLMSHPSVKDGGIGVVAVSGGSSFGLLMGWLLPQVVAVVAINSPIFPIEDLYCGDKLIKRGVGMNQEIMKHSREASGALVVKDAWVFLENIIIPIWESETHVLALVSEADGQVPPVLMENLYEKYPEEKRHLIEVARYPGAGHLLEPPYTALCRSCYNPPAGTDLFWGGEKMEHAKAQEAAWTRSIDFLKAHLPR